MLLTNVVNARAPEPTPMQFSIGPRGSPHTFATPDVGSVMRDVILALLPGTAVYAWLFGWGVLSNVVIACAFALLCEAVALRLRGRSIAAGLSDNSALVTGWLFALALPPMSAWWLLAIGALFAIGVAKHLYGGLGYNPFNPAMVGYVVLLISFPQDMTLWLAPLSLELASLDLVETLTVVFGGALPEAYTLDAITRATPLDATKTGLGLDQPVGQIRSGAVFGAWAGEGWEWVAIAWLVGGVWLLYRRIITWHIPVGLCLALAVMAGVFYLIDAQHYSSPVFHLLSGGALMGAFFIATDPVTAPSSNTGRLVYAAGIGVLTYVIRTWGGYPDGIAFAVLLANMCAPTIDYYFRTKPYGH